jgi:signal transduction histidine kinase
VFATTAAFLFAAAVLRSVLRFEGDQLALILILLAAWLALLLLQEPLSRRWPPAFALYVVLQAAIVLVLLGQSDGSDYFGVLLAVPSMQAMQRWPVRWAVVLIALFAVLVTLGVVEEYSPANALALAAVYTAVNLFLGSYVLTARRATEARAHNEALAADLREANQRLADSARQAERLAGARERQRLARDLHDSVTQTLFSMTLAAHSAALLRDREPGGLEAQLDQLEQLGGSAKAQLRGLRDALPGRPAAEGGLVASLRRHVEERAAQDGLTVHLKVKGERRLPSDEEEALLRIVQEALNNVVKHAGVAEAEVSVRLPQPARVEIVDRGRGFEPSDVLAGQAEAGMRGAGLSIMGERASDIGWRLAVDSAAGGGTRVVAQEQTDASESGGQRDGDASEAREQGDGAASEAREGGGDRG